MNRLKNNFKVNGLELINFINLSDREKRLVRSWRNHKDVRSWMFNDSLISSRKHKKFIGSLISNEKDFYWLLKRKDGQYLGVIYFNRVDTKNKNAYLGIYRNPLSKGIGHIVMQCLKTLAFDKAKLHTLKAEVLKTNKRAIKFYKREGFKTEGKLNNFILRDKTRKDVVIMGLDSKKDGYSCFYGRD